MKKIVTFDYGDDKDGVYLNYGDDNGDVYLYLVMKMMGVMLMFCVLALESCILRRDLH